MIGASPPARSIAAAFSSLLRKEEDRDKRFDTMFGKADGRDSESDMVLWETTELHST